MTTRRPDEGFSLLEMLVVLAILGLALALVAGGKRWRSDTTDLRAALGTVSRVSRVARETAQLTQQQVSVIVDTEKHIVALPDRGGSFEKLPLCVKMVSSGMEGAVSEEQPAGRLRFMVTPEGLFSIETLLLACHTHQGSIGFDRISGRVSLREH